jgi:hypothetical protein
MTTPRLRISAAKILPQFFFSTTAAPLASSLVTGESNLRRVSDASLEDRPLEDWLGSGFGISNDSSSRAILWTSHSHDGGRGRRRGVTVPLDTVPSDLADVSIKAKLTGRGQKGDEQKKDQTRARHEAIEAQHQCL